MSAASAVNLKRVTLELGGKSALVVFNDADGNLIFFLTTNMIETPDKVPTKRLRQLNLQKKIYLVLNHANNVPVCSVKSGSFIYLRKIFANDRLFKSVGNLEYLTLIFYLNSYICFLPDKNTDSKTNIDYIGCLVTDCIYTINVLF